MTNHGVNIANNQSWKQGEKNSKRKRRSRKYREYLRKQRARAARIKAKRDKHRRKYRKEKSSKGFFMVFAHYLIEYVKIKEYLEKEVKFAKQSNSTFSVLDLIISLVGLIALGIPRIYNVATKQEERLLAEAMKLDKFASPCTIYRFLKKFAIAALCQQIQEANRKMLYMFFVRQDFVVVDGDASTIRSYDNSKEGSVPGFNKLRPGKPCFQAIAYFANGFCIRPELVGGKGVPIKGDLLLEHLKEVRRQCEKIHWVRLDSGFASSSTLQGLDNFSCTDHSREKIRFITNLGKNCQGVTEVMNSSKCRQWVRVKSGVEIQDHSNIQIYKNYPQKHRIILVKEYLNMKKSWGYYALVTNELEVTAADLYRFYHKRQCIENFFDETKNSYFIEHLPSKKLQGNNLYFNIICLTFNLLVIFRRKVLSQKYQNIHLRTLQKNYFDLDLEFNGRYLIIPRWLPTYRSILLILRRLKKINITLEYRICG